MQCGSLVLSLLLLATVCHSQFTGAALAAGAAAVAGTAVAGVALAGLARAIGGGRRSGGRSIRRGSSRRGGFRRGNRGFGRRGRRAVLDYEVDTEDAEEQSAIWGSVAAADNDGCALKLICLLEAAASDADDDEQTVLNFIGDLEGTDKMVVSTKLPYEAAGWLGKFRGAGACEVVYGTLCPYNKADMMQLISSIWSSMATEEANPDVVSA